MPRIHTHPVRIYYEDTDFSGAVYHANYLKYMERAREHLLGPDALRDMYDNTGIGFVVYKAELTYREPAKFGDVLEVRTVVSRTSAWRAMFHQNIWRGEQASPLVEGVLQLVCVDGDGKLVRLPDHVAEGIDSWASQDNA
jgi:tol-pal system-associated acyl-CoA thioesterase